MSELLHRMQIAELYARYNWAVDNSDGEAFSLTFSEDGAFIGTIGSFEGRAQLKEFARKQNLKERGLQHWNSNIVLSFESAHVVHGKAYMLVLCPDEPGPKIERAGFYSDLLIREGDDWFFKTRRFRLLAGSG